MKDSFVRMFAYEYAQQPTPFCAELRESYSRDAGQRWTKNMIYNPIRTMVERARTFSDEQGKRDMLGSKVIFDPARRCGCGVGVSCFMCIFMFRFACI